MYKVVWTICPKLGFLCQNLVHCMQTGNPNMKLLNNVPLRQVCFYVPQKWRKWQKLYYVPIHIYY